ncbi:hypothetical protein KUC58_19665 [Pseudomonas aeruginosa]|uniref:hypothetical protein n=1 Tax=Pseudomonas aeruginosa TaxID=287 RepID=UPI0011B4E203|nr:hypothetical protein [Pseudomonas aeruginosa]MCV0133348.1 hypothetical protein [Pseudomonas aeruginosa]TWW52342.1 hypothetical protein FSC46_02355 [Pseudomonas aeruginosa]HCF2284641.1 hypothetical protein [Pseudomonas aeruginosa]
MTDAERYPLRAIALMSTDELARGALLAILNESLDQARQHLAESCWEELLHDDQLIQRQQLAAEFGLKM